MSMSEPMRDCEHDALTSLTDRPMSENDVE